MTNIAIESRIAIYSGFTHYIHIISYHIFLIQIFGYVVWMVGSKFLLPEIIQMEKK